MSVQSSSHNKTFSNAGLEEGKSGSKPNSSTCDLSKAFGAENIPIATHFPQRTEPAVSTFQGASFVLEQYKMFLLRIWGELSQRIARVSVDDISSLQENIEGAFEQMPKGGVDLSPLRDRIKELFEKARSYDMLRSKVLDQTTVETKNKSLALAKDKLEGAKAEDYLAAKHLTSVEDSLKEIQTRKANLEAELKTLCEQERDLKQQITTSRAHANSTQAAILAATEEITLIENTSVVSVTDVENLNVVKEELLALRANLINFNIF